MASVNYWLSSIEKAMARLRTSIDNAESNTGPGMALHDECTTTMEEVGR